MPTLHVTNGDSAGDKLRRVVSGRVGITADVLHEGPVPAVNGDAWYDTRARFLASYHLNAEEIRRDLVRRDQEIVEAAKGDGVVLWFEHDLFDQLLLIRTLDLVVPLKADAAYDPTVVSGFSRTVSLICIDRFPGVERFIGLGQLSKQQLATLIGTEQPVTPDQFTIASAAWNAFRSPDPRGLVDLAAGLKGDAHDALPFLRDALFRFFAEYPSTTTGLAQTEQLALEALSDGPSAAGALFVATQAREPRPFMGDWTFYDILRALAAARVPLVTIEEGPDEIDLQRRMIAITDAGRDVLAARRDRIALNGIDLWRGGVHLAGTDSSPFRWDVRRERLVS